MSKVDELELMEQLKEELIRSDNYASIEIVVGDEKMPYVNFKLHGKEKQAGKLILVLEETIKMLVKEHLDAYIYAKDRWGTQCTGIIQGKEEEDE